MLRIKLLIISNKYFNDEKRLGKHKINNNGLVVINNLKDYQLRRPFQSRDYFSNPKTLQKTQIINYIIDPK